MNFRIILRGHVVDPHYIVNDLKFREGIKYRPQLLGNMEVCPVISFSSNGYLVWLFQLI